MAIRFRPLSRLTALSSQFNPTHTQKIRIYRPLSTMSIPKTMKAVQIQKTGGIDVLDYHTDLLVPTPKEDEVLIKNSIIGVNYIDTYHRSGLYTMPLPKILGQDATGTLVTPPSSSSQNHENLKEGDKVIYMHTATYAEYTAVPLKKLHKIPDGVSPETACAGYLQALTALTLVEEAHKVQKGDWVLVPAAAGGVGGLLVQLLKQRGVHTIASASTEEKRKLALEFGAEVAVAYEDVVETVKEKTGGKGVIAVFDGVGQATWETALQVVARKGTVVSFGNASGAVEPFKIARLGEKNVKIARPRLFAYMDTQEEVDFYLGLLWDTLKKSDFKVPVHEVYPLSDVRRAHSDLEGRKTTGKLLLKP